MTISSFYRHALVRMILFSAIFSVYATVASIRPTAPQTLSPACMPSVTVSAGRFLPEGDVSLVVQNTNTSAAAYLTGFAIRIYQPLDLLSLKHVSLGDGMTNQVVWTGTSRTSPAIIRDVTTSEWVHTVALPASSTSMVYLDFDGIGPSSLADLDLGWHTFTGTSLTFSCDASGAGGIESRLVIPLPAAPATPIPMGVPPGG